MTTVLGYINTGAASTGFTPPAGMWCRPQHKPTCCMFVHAASSCCMCVPSSATCFIIEMWSQGGGGGGGCCCGQGGTPGGQGGSYGWVACTTSGTNHILCACTCVCGTWNCGCSQCTTCSGNYGQLTVVCNCTTQKLWCLCGGHEGCWGCFFGSTGCCCFGSQCSNTWLYFKNCSGLLATPTTTSAATFTPKSLNFCSTTQTSITPDACAYTQPASTTTACVCVPSSPVDKMFNTTTCSCFSSPYVWLGACGWSDPASLSTPFGCLNGQPQTTAGQACGGGMAVGGAAYAGGDQAWQKCVLGTCYSCWAQHGNWPGGGGMSSQGYTAWTQPGFGAPGLILMSWC